MSDSRGASYFGVVGIGASAGGIAASQELFRTLSAHLGLSPLLARRLVMKANGDSWSRNAAPLQTS